MNSAHYQQHQQRQYDNYGNHDMRHGHPNDIRHRGDLRHGQERPRINGHHSMQHPSHGFDARMNPGSMDRSHLEPSHPHAHRVLHDPHSGERGMAEKMHFEQGLGTSAPIASNSPSLPRTAGSTQGIGMPLTNMAPIGRPKPSSIPPVPQFPRHSVSELVQVPAELAAFAADPKFQQILLRVKEQTMVNFITLNRISEGFVESAVIDAPSKESAQLARNLIETHLRLQQKVKAAENRLHRVQTDLFSTQGEIASGQRVDFAVSPSLIGMIIGKKGARIKQIEQETGVTSINVVDDGRVTIFGPDSSSVQKARDQVELQEESLFISELQTEWLSSRFNAGTLADIKSGSNLIVARINKERHCIDCVGTTSAVNMAKYLLATQLEYVDKQIEIEATEREAREKLLQMRKQYGMNNGRRGMREDNSFDVRPTERMDRGAERGDRRQVAGDSTRGAVAPSGAARKVGREVVVPNPAASSPAVTATAPTSNLVLDTKGSSSKAVEDALDSLITAPSTTTGPTTQASGGATNSRGGKGKAAKKGAEELLVTAKNGIETVSLPASLVVQQGNKEGSKAEKDTREGRSNKNKAGNTSTAAQAAAPGSAATATTSSSNDVASGTAEVGVNARGKAAVRKGKNASKTQAEESSSLQVIPPPPVLSVPPAPPAPVTPPASTTATTPVASTVGGGNQKRREKGKAKNAAPESNAEQTEKKSMLVKINRPFLEAQKASAANDSSTASATEQIVASLHSHSSSRPLAAAMTTALTSPRPSGTPQESRSATTNDTSNRRRKNRANQSTEVTALSAATQDLDLATDRSAALPDKKAPMAKEEKVAAESKPAEPPLPPRTKRAGPPPTPGPVAIAAIPPGLSDGPA